jgi:hypothetical protein
MESSICFCSAVRGAAVAWGRGDNEPINSEPASTAAAHRWAI